MSAVEAGRGAIGLCPWTRQKVKAHIGPKLQYWAYEGGQPDFDDGYEVDTAWHLGWKSLVKEESCEAIVEDKYLADIYISGEYVIELQRRPISEAGAKERAAFYARVTGQRCVYLVDISDYWQKRFKLGSQKGRNNFLVEWKPKRAWLWALAKTNETHVFCEFNYANDKLLKIWVFKGQMHASFISKKDFIHTYLDPALKPGFAGPTQEALEQVIIA